MASLIVGLRGGRHLGLERLDAVCELSRNLPRGELPPQDDFEDAPERMPLVLGHVDAAVLANQFCQHAATIPRQLLAAMIDVSELRVGPRTAGRLFQVEHFERNLRAVRAPPRNRLDHHTLTPSLAGRRPRTIDLKSS